MKKIKATNPELIELIRDLNKKSQENNNQLWKYLAKRLSTSKRNRISVNISHLNRYTKEGEIVAVPGKVLGSGKADHPITVAAFAFSNRAQLKIKNASGNCLTIKDLMKKNPKGKNIKILG